MCSSTFTACSRTGSIPHADMHADTDTHTHTHSLTHTRTHTHTRTRTSNAHAHAHTHTQTHRHTDTQTHRHTDTQTHRHRDTETHRHTDTHTHTLDTMCHRSQVRANTQPVKSVVSSLRGHGSQGSSEFCSRLTTYIKQTLHS